MQGCVIQIHWFFPLSLIKETHWMPRLLAWPPWHPRMLCVKQTKDAGDSRLKTWSLEGSMDRRRERKDRKRGERGRCLTIGIRSNGTWFIGFRLSFFLQVRFSVSHVTLDYQFFHKRAYWLSKGRDIGWQINMMSILVKENLHILRPRPKSTRYTMERERE